MQKKVLILILIFSFICAISPQVLYAEAEQVIENDETGIPDKGLYQAILDALHKERNETFTKAEAESLTELDANGMVIFKREKIKSLKGIGYLSNLTKLAVYSNELAELAGIESLSNLHTLIASGNQLTNLRGIEKLRELKMLDVSLNQLNSLNEVRDLTKLTDLLVYINKLSSLEDIANLTNLKCLSISGNNITSLDVVENMVQLERLEASDNKLVKLPDLTKHTKLDAGQTYLLRNKIPQSEWRKKLPKHLLKERAWLSDQRKFQSIKKFLKITKPSVRKIHAKTKTLTGKTQMGATVSILSSKGRNIKGIKSVTANKKGIFKLKKLDLKRFAGRKLKIKSKLDYEYHDDSKFLKTIVIKVRKK